MQFRLNTDFDITAAMKTIAEVGGISIPMLHDDDRRMLLGNAMEYQYSRRPVESGKKGVRQDLCGVDVFPEDSPFFTLRNDWNALLVAKLEGLGPQEHPFNTPVRFNEISLQLYEPRSFGITPHHDSSRNVNLICVFNLTGNSRFGLCDDRKGTKGVVILEDTPGNVILLRSVGFKTDRPPPFHFLKDIPELRITFGLRQVIPK